MGLPWRHSTLANAFLFTLSKLQEKKKKKKKKKKMKMKKKNLVIIVLISVSILTHPISANIFLNASSIPDWVNKTKCVWDKFQNLKGCRLGNTLHGLSNLKTYLQTFGYIPRSQKPPNFTDLFDPLLQSALQTYQANFHLNVTGYLDDQTLLQIQRPRCGIPDIIINASNPFHSVSHFSFFPGSPRWPLNRPDLTYGFALENQLSDDVKAVFRRAFDRWSAVTPLTFSLVEPVTAADIWIGFHAGDHGDGEPFDGALGTLAHAFSPPNGHFHLDADESWVVTGDLSLAPPAAVDLESVAVHEIGHLLGLGHSSVQDSIMFPSLGSRTRKVDLAADDVAGIQELYGGNPNGHMSPPLTTATPLSPPVQERDRSKNAAAPTLYRFLWGQLLLLGVELFFIIN